MRYIGLVLALGAISWTLYQMAGDGKSETAIPAEYQHSIDAAKDLERAMKKASQRSLQEAEEK